MTETQNTSRRPGALIAMSGGVDSSAAAVLLQAQGYAVSGPCLCSAFLSGYRFYR